MQKTYAKNLLSFYRKHLWLRRGLFYFNLCHKIYEKTLKILRNRIDENLK